MFRLSLALALAWMALTGEFTLENFIEGLLLVAITLSITQHVMGRESYLTRFRILLGFVLFFLKELVAANLHVAYRVLSPRLNIKPAVIAVPLTVQSDEEIMLLANLITLTPGTLSLDVSTDKRVLYVHTIDVDDVELFRQKIKNGFERRVMEAARWQN